MERFRRLLSVVLYAVLAILAVWLLFSSTRMYVYTKHAEHLTNQLQPYQQAGASDGKTILFVGDSFGYGTGASKDTATLAGLMGRYLPDSRIVNKAKNGTKSYALSQRINADIDGYYDIVVVGANDVIHPEVDLSSANNNYNVIYKTASMNARHVIAITTGDFRDISFFVWPLNYYFGERFTKLNQLAREEAGRFGNLIYIDTFDSDIRPENPRIFESEDGLHPNDLGTYYWFQKILKQTNELSF